jgi:fused signal recognition particle receptor
MGFFDKLKAGLARTKQQIFDRFDELVQQADAPEQRTRQIDVDTIEALEEILIGADIGVAATERIVTSVRSRSRQGESLRDLVKQEIRQIFDTVAPAAASNGQAPHVTLIVGVNGTGKTTTNRQARQPDEKGGPPAARLRRRHVPRRGGGAARGVGRPRRRGHRAGERGLGSGRGGVRRDSVGQGPRPRSHPRRHRRPAAHPRQPDERAREDSARRRQGVRRRAARGIAGARLRPWGRTGCSRRRSSRRWPGVTGIVLTKLDGTAKGGVAVAIAHDLKLPIQYVGVGEGIDDLIPFSPDDYVDALFQAKW